MYICKKELEGCQDKRQNIRVKIDVNFVSSFIGKQSNAHTLQQKIEEGTNINWQTVHKHISIIGTMQD